MSKEQIMTISTFASGTETRAGTTEYRPGICNIGPEEIARRRMAGHIGLLSTAVLFAVLVAFDAPPLLRLIVALPAAVSASGYLQAWLRFCAGFGSRGVFNFGRLGQMEEVADADARRRDRTRANQIGLASLLIGAVVGIVAAILPM